MKLGLGIYQVIWYLQKSFVRGVNRVLNLFSNSEEVYQLFHNIYNNELKTIEFPLGHYETNQSAEETTAWV